jgi:hypothetical protein
VPGQPTTVLPEPAAAAAQRPLTGLLPGADAALNYVPAGVGELLEEDSHARSDSNQPRGQPAPA